MPPKHLHVEQHRGLVPTDQLGTGTANGTKYLAGDQTWQTTPVVPTSPSDLLGYAWKLPVVTATTVAGTLASSFENGDTVGGFVVSTGQRILIKNQAAPAENGIYTVNASGAPTRATDANSGAELVAAAVSVGGGTNGFTSWVCTAPSPVTLGTDPLPWSQLRTNNDAPFFLRTALNQFMFLEIRPPLLGIDEESVDIHGNDGPATGGAVSLTGGDGSDGYGAFGTFAGGDSSGGGYLDLAGGDGTTGNPGGIATIYGGYGDEGTDEPAHVAAHGGDGAGNPGKVEIYTDASTGTLGQVLVTDGTYGTWQDIDGGSA